jgi:hypothetical protein
MYIYSIFLKIFLVCMYTYKKMTSRRIAKANNVNQHLKNPTKVAEYHSKFDNPRQNPDDKIYLNIVIPYSPNGDGVSQAIFQQQFNIPVLDVPDNYYLSIVRFSIPCQNIPIINFANYIQEFPNTDPNLTVFSVTLEYMGDISQAYVDFATETPFLNPGTLSATNTSVAFNNPYYFTYTYDNILAMFNAALATAHAGLAAPPAGSGPPVFIYDPFNYRIGLVADAAYYGDDAGTPIDVFVNYESFSTFFSGMPSVLFGYNEANEQDVQLIIRDQYNNGYGNYYPTDATSIGAPIVPVDLPGTYSGSGYWLMWQDYPTLINMNSFKNLTLRSNLLPIIQEFTLASNSNLSTQTSLATLGSLGILANFEPIDTFGWESRGNVTYQPVGPYHLINLAGQAPISNLDISIYWSDQFGQYYPLNIAYNQYVTIKLAFFKKDTFTS